MQRHRLQFIAEKTRPDARPKPVRASTILNILSVLRRVLAVAVDKGTVDLNRCRNLDRLLSKGKRQQSDAVRHISTWSRQVVATRLGLGRENEREFYPLLAFLLSTGWRKGEAVGLKWEDVDLESSRTLIRRALVGRRLGTPKSGRSRSVVVSPALADALPDLLLERRQQAVNRGWQEVPELVFCSQTGGPLDERNVTRAWSGLR